MIAVRNLTQFERSTTYCMSCGGKLADIKLLLKDDTKWEADDFWFLCSQCYESLKI